MNCSKFIDSKQNYLYRIFIAVNHCGSCVVKTTVKYRSLENAVGGKRNNLPTTTPNNPEHTTFGSSSTDRTHSYRKFNYFSSPQPEGILLKWIELAAKTKGQPRKRSQQQTISASSLDKEYYFTKIGAVETRIDMSTPHPYSTLQDENLRQTYNDSTFTGNFSWNGGIAPSITMDSTTSSNFQTSVYPNVSQFSVQTDTPITQHDLPKVFGKKGTQMTVTFLRGDTTIKAFDQDLKSTSVKDKITMETTSNVMDTDNVEGEPLVLTNIHTEQPTGQWLPDEEKIENLLSDDSRSELYIHSATAMSSPLTITLGKARDSTLQGGNTTNFSKTPSIKAFANVTLSSQKLGIFQNSVSSQPPSDQKNYFTNAILSHYSAITARETKIVTTTLIDRGEMSFISHPSTNEIPLSTTEKTYTLDRSAEKKYNTKLLNNSVDMEKVTKIYHSESNSVQIESDEKSQSDEDD